MFESREGEVITGQIKVCNENADIRETNTRYGGSEKCTIR
jgi:hypothetical protein